MKTNYGSNFDASTYTFTTPVRGWWTAWPEIGMCILFCFSQKVRDPLHSRLCVAGIYMFYTNQLTDYDSAGSLGPFRNIGGTEYLETRSWSRTEVNVVREGSGSGDGAFRYRQHV